MKWSLQELKKFKDIGLPIDAQLDLRDSLLQRDKEILDLSIVEVKGQIAMEASEYILSYTMDYTITLPSSRSLAPVELPKSVQVIEVFQTLEDFKNLEDEEKLDEIIVIDGQTISLDESVADNILLNIPLRILTAEEENSTDLPTGSFWQVISEEDFAKASTPEDDDQTNIDPRLAKLKDFFED